MDWQPIETAPKDGRRIKLLIPYSAKLFDEEQCTDEGFWSEEDMRDWNGTRLRGCWRYDGDDGPFDLTPTHWMPLPAPPNEIV